MKSSHKILVMLSFVFMTCFLCFGYAALTSTLEVEGTANAKPAKYDGVYIKSVEVYSTSGATCLENGFILPTSHSATADAIRSGASVTYKITVHNNTDVTYWYIGQKIPEAYEQNSLVGTGGGITVITKDHPSDSAATFDSEDWIPPQTERDFYVTYTFGANAQNPCSTLINFHFDIHMDAVHDEFLAVLNNSKTPTSYVDLATVFNEEYAKDGSTSISSDSHPEVFAALFGDLNVNIDGEEKHATVVIRRENLDGDATSGDDYSGSGPKGCEYTLYITVESTTPGTNPTVYAIAYSCGASGMGDDWYQVGELYEGTAPITARSEIDYENWTAVQKDYEIADGIVYKVGYPNGDQYDIMKTMEQLISAQDQDIFNDIDNKNIFKKVYDIIQRHKNSTDPAVLGLKQAFEDASIFYRNLNNGQEFKVVRDKYTRAEIIHALKKIQSALDYYYQAYPE